jgi:alanyl-tRNA synthetase
MKSSNIRKQFIDFFLEKQHTFAKPSPVIPQNDPTILFINAGMNQFKDILLGLGKRDYSRAVNSQICIRVSGKHNDLEEVGLDTTHLTSFEMLGNWSFGDYYKKEAISWAWELFTEKFSIPKEILYASVYETDDEAVELWKSETDISQDHIIRFGKKDNFWEMGAEGPCGPCSEIHVDLGPEACDKKNIDHVCEVNGECNRYVELWNLVFIQYNRLSDGTLQDLPAKHVDTGAGLERITSYLQNTTSVYETDLFVPILKKIEELTGQKYEDSIAGMPHRVMADHIRTVTFAIADNVLPSNEGRGYVLRRIIRRALRYAKKLGVNQPILYKLVDTVVDIMSGYLEYLPERKDFIKTIIESEERSFLRTLESGISIFDELAQKLIKANKTEIPGSEAFKLYDTFGFPLDLTQMMAREKNLTVNINDFQKELEAQKNRSRQAKKTNTFDGAKGPIGGEARVVNHESEKLEMARHHTGTHLLHAALREVLGTHVAQSGSLVDTHRLRFDFSHFKAMSKEEIKQVEELINSKIKESLNVTITEMPIDKAKETGALSFFGEKYDDIVKVVAINDFSKELCGGTHVENIGEIEQIKIISESAIAAGTRRIEAIAGKENIANHELQKKTKSIQLIKNKIEQANKIIEQMKQYSQDQKLPDYGDLETKTLEELKKLEDKSTEDLKKIDKQFSQLKNKEAGKDTSDLLKEMKDLAGMSVLIKELKDYDIPMLRTLSDNIINSGQNLLTVLASSKEGKGFFLVKLSKDIANTNITAQQIIEVLTDIAGGGGGGRADMAQAGGAKPDKIAEALKHAEEFLSKN